MKKIGNILQLIQKDGTVKLLQKAGLNINYQNYLIFQVQLCILD